MDKLTEKQKRFIDFYVETANATEACRLAGYKGKNLEVVGSQNLTKLKEYIQERLSKKEDARIASQDEVLRTITEVMRNDLAADKDRLKAAELMGKRYAIFTEKIEVSGEIGFADELKKARERAENAKR